MPDWLTCSHCQSSTVLVGSKLLSEPLSLNQGSSSSSNSEGGGPTIFEALSLILGFQFPQRTSTFVRYFNGSSIEYIEMPSEDPERGLSLCLSCELVLGNLYKIFSLFTSLSNGKESFILLNSLTNGNQPAAFQPQEASNEPIHLQPEDMQLICVDVGADDAILNNTDVNEAAADELILPDPAIQSTSQNQHIATATGSEVEVIDLADDESCDNHFEDDNESNITDPNDINRPPDEVLGLDSPLQLNFRCETCSESFDTETDLVVHNNSAHMDDVPIPSAIHKCRICNQSFKYKTNFLSHMKVHEAGQRPYRCLFPTCSATFQTKPKLKHHQRIHFTTQESNIPIPIPKSKRRPKPKPVNSQERAVVNYVTESNCVNFLDCEVDITTDPNEDLVQEDGSIVRQQEDPNIVIISATSLYNSNSEPT